METLFSFRASSPVGPLFLAASTKGLVRLEFEARVQNLPKTTQIQESKKVLAPYLRQLSEYFAGDRREFSLPLDLRGTDFQRACWHALIEIPYGETRSYGQLAREMGIEKSTRAVARACALNRVSLLVPCHRVVGASGSLTGYRWGVERKKALLDAEALRAAAPR